MRLLAAAAVLTFYSVLPLSSGELLDRYLPELHISANWAELGHLEQVRITAELAEENNLRDARYLDACLDTVATDTRFRQLDYGIALTDCLHLARSE